ncbi:diguanylate cyclase [Bacillus sp. T3]|uniref:GGDEF domain-containing response regulator n=1 Tax=Bacillus sp. T3 TaxID=467262 RepID=UPI002982944A|nr:diguanylate cyclase [Bacillus sp. T3]
MELKQIFEQSVLIDELTQVFNKRFMEFDLPKRLDDWRRSDYSLTIAVIDIDHFSTLNKRFDFLIGDRILADLALFLQENIRSTDTVYRLGEDRFLLVFPRSSEQKASEVLNRLLKQYSQKTHEYHNQTLSITFSAGIFEVQHPDLSSKEMVSFAEQALEKAKREGRARVEMFNDKTLITKKKLFISVIEHDSIIRTMLMKVLASLDLEQYEIQIELFEDGVKFVESDWIRLNGYHFIVFEAVMPQMNGIEILYKLKELKLRSPMRILMLAGKKDEKEIARALKLGADDYMTKPFSITEVKARIERLLQRML